MRTVLKTLLILEEVLRSILDPSASLMNPKVTLVFAGIGWIPVIWVLGSIGWSPRILTGLVPVVAAIHAIYLGRGYLFLTSEGTDFRSPRRVLSPLLFRLLYGSTA